MGLFWIRAIEGPLKAAFGTFMRCCIIETAWSTVRSALERRLAERV
jgi:hypothetical protein